MQGTGYPCDEEAESPVRKSEVTKKTAPAGSYYQAGPAKRGDSASLDGSWNQSRPLQSKLKPWTRWTLRASTGCGSRKPALKSTCEM